MLTGHTYRSAGDDGDLVLKLFHRTHDFGDLLILAYDTGYLLPPPAGVHGSLIL